ncbi:MAG: hypothetical protein WKG07_40625 [Hymenobacter sp.]
MTAKQVDAAAQAAADARRRRRAGPRSRRGRGPRARSAVRERIQRRRPVGEAGGPHLRCGRSRSSPPWRPRPGPRRRRPPRVAHRQLAARYGTVRVTAAARPAAAARVDQAQADIAAAVRALVDARDEYAAGDPGRVRRDAEPRLSRARSTQDEDAETRAVCMARRAWPSDGTVTAGGRRYEIVDSTTWTVRIGMRRPRRPGQSAAAARATSMVQKLAARCPDRPVSGGPARPAGAGRAAADPSCPLLVRRPAETGSTCRRAPVTSWPRTATTPTTPRGSCR